MIIRHGIRVLIRPEINVPNRPDINEANWTDIDVMIRPDANFMVIPDVMIRSDAKETFLSHNFFLSLLGLTTEGASVTDANPLARSVVV